MMTGPAQPKRFMRQSQPAPSRLRRLNAVMIIQALRSQDSCTLTDLGRITGLSHPALEDVVGELVEQGWAELIGIQAAVVGRPARRYRFRAAAHHVLGLDMGAHRIRALLADMDGTVRGRASISVEPELPAGRRLAQAGIAISRCLAEAKMPAEHVSAVAAATSGLVDRRGVVTLASGIPDWAGVDIAGWLRERLSCPIFAENDTKLAVLAEKWRGAACGADDVVYVLAGMRTAASLIIAGQLQHGHTGAVGEIGLLPEARWGAAQDHITRWRAAHTDVPADEVARHVFDAARAGDSSARGAVRRYSHDLAVGIAALVLTLDPERVVIGGGYSRAGDVLLDPLRGELERRLPRMPTLVRSELGGDAPVLGAVRLALDAVEAEAFWHELPALRAATNAARAL